MLMSDDMIVGIDSYNDKRTGYMFRLTAAGAMADGYVFNDGDEDWAMERRLGRRGPRGFARLGRGVSHSAQPASLCTARRQHLGLLIIRRTARNGERVSWPLMPPIKDGQREPVG